MFKNVFTFNTFFIICDLLTNFKHFTFDEFTSFDYVKTAQ